MVVYEPALLPTGMRIKESIPNVTPRTKIVITKKLTAALFPAVRVTLMAIAEDAKIVPSLIAAGAGALLSTSVDSVAILVEAAEDLPVGVRIDAAHTTDVKQATENGADFIVFNHEESEAAAFLEHEPGRVLLLEDNIDEEQLRLISGMRLDGIIVSTPPQPLSVRNQLSLRQITDVTRTPLIVPIEDTPDTSTLHTFRNAGALAILTPSNPSMIEETVLLAKEIPDQQPIRNDDLEIALVPSPTEGDGE